jgi:hypothetical protein
MHIKTSNQPELKLRAGADMVWALQKISGVEHLFAYNTKSLLCTPR